MTRPPTDPDEQVAAEVADDAPAPGKQADSKRRRPGAPANNSNAVTHGQRRAKKRGRSVIRDDYDTEAEKAARTLFRGLPRDPRRALWTELEASRLRTKATGDRRGWYTNAGESKQIHRIYTDTIDRLSRLTTEVMKDRDGRDDENQTVTVYRAFLEGEIDDDGTPTDLGVIREQLRADPLATCAVCGRGVAHEPVRRPESPVETSTPPDTPEAKDTPSDPPRASRANTERKSSSPPRRREDAPGRVPVDYRGEAPWEKGPRW